MIEVVRVGRITLCGNASQLANALLELVDRDVLPGCRSRKPRDVLFEQRAAVVIRAGEHDELRDFSAELHPGNLDVIDRPGEQNTRERMDLDVFFERSPVAREALLK